MPEGNLREQLHPVPSNYAEFRREVRAIADDSLKERFSAIEERLSRIGQRLKDARGG